MFCDLSGVRFKQLLLVAALVLVAVLALPAATLSAQQTETLADFVSEEGKFSVWLPQEPQVKQLQISPDTTQYQFGVNLGSKGAIIVSYQDTPNLKGANAEKIKNALNDGRNALVKSFKGKVRSEDELLLEDAHPGLDIVMDLPQAGTMAHCRLFIVGHRLYQILIPGLSEFVQSEEVEKVMASFQLMSS